MVTENPTEIEAKIAVNSLEEYGPAPIPLLMAYFQTPILSRNLLVGLFILKANR